MARKRLWIYERMTYFDCEKRWASFLSWKGLEIVRMLYGIMASFTSSTSFTRLVAGIYESVALSEWVVSRVR